MCEGMKIKGTTKRAEKRPNFWGKYEKGISESLKEQIYNQYYSFETLYVYCDCSMQIETNLMSIANSYVHNGSVIVENNLIYPPNDCKGKNIYGELQAIISSLCNFETHLNRFIKNIVIYSDVNNINEILAYKVNFNKVYSLSSTQSKLIQLYEIKKIQNPNLNISIRYLPKALKANNPFNKAAHNAARKILQK